MTTNRVKRMLAEQHEYKAHEDAESRNGTFEVQDDHRAFGACFCPMCGGGVDRSGATTQEQSGDDVKDAAAIALKLCQWAISKSTRMMMVCVAHKIVHPSYTVRDIQDKTNYSKTEVCKHLNNAVRAEPRLARALGFSTSGQTEQGKG